MIFANTVAVVAPILCMPSQNYMQVSFSIWTGNLCLGFFIIIFSADIATDQQSIPEVNCETPKVARLK